MVNRPFRKQKVADALLGYLFISPVILVIGTFTFFSMIYAFYLSFTRFDMFSSPLWTGLQNYRLLLGNPDFKRAMFNTVYYAVGVVPAQTMIAIGLAVLLNQKVRGIPFFRAAYFVPTITSTVAASFIFMWLFLKQGVINHTLSLLQLPADNSWLENPLTAMPVLMLSAIWGTAPHFMVIFLAALQDIPQTVYEASEIDGANTWQSFRHVTLPLLRPAIFLVAVLGTIGTFQVFDQMYIMTRGGPLDSTTSVVFLIWRTAFQDFNMGYASAMAVVLFVIIYALTILQRRTIDTNIQF